MIECFTDPRAGLARCVDDPAFDLLIVNGNMPGLTGPELITELRTAQARAGSEPLPIMINSASELSLLDGLRAGADLALGVPLDPLELAFRVRALFPNAPWVTPQR